MVTINMEETANNIKQLMDDNNMSVKDVSIGCGFRGPQAVYKWIHGDALPSIDNLVILAELLGVTINELIVIERSRKE